MHINVRGATRQYCLSGWLTDLVKSTFVLKHRFETPGYKWVGRYLRIYDTPVIIALPNCRLPKYLRYLHCLGNYRDVCMRGRMGQVVRRLTSRYRKLDIAGFNSGCWHCQPCKPSISHAGVDKLVAICVQWMTTVDCCEGKAYGCTTTGTWLMQMAAQATVCWFPAVRTCILKRSNI
jgi:hypothetical protein